VSGVAFLPVGDRDRAEMLRAIGVRAFEDLLEDIPPALRLKRGLDLPAPLSELEATQLLRRLAALNSAADGRPCFLGAGAYDHYVPSVVDEIASRAEFYTAYTPYQPEVSQGTLQTIFEFQSLVARLTGMEVANASLYDGGTAIAEAVLMAGAINGRREVVASGWLNPMRLAVLETYLKATGMRLRLTGRRAGTTDPDEVRGMVGDATSCVVVENPNFLGAVEDAAAISDAARSRGALTVASVDPISMGLLAPAREYGADIVVGEGQSLGNYLNYGGPYLGFMATRREHIRRLPGRIVGRTVDKAGKVCYCLTLQTREQHIRREKATSNICTNEALVALRAAVYMCWLGRAGLGELARLCLSKAVYAEKAFAARGLPLAFKAPFFKEFALRLPVDATRLADDLARQGILAGVPLGRFYPDLADCLLVAFTEKRTRAEIDMLVERVAEFARKGVA
jgi:glycine dehydrogenase subunit 1